MITLKTTAPTTKPTTIVIKEPSLIASSINEKAIVAKKIPAEKAAKSALILSG
ncbi:MAG: hypothetical protein ACR2F1_13285 [Nitrososphaeraceae archaeon]